MLEAGASAPDFTLPDQDGNEVSLSGLKGETVVLYWLRNRRQAATTSTGQSPERTRS